MPPEDEGAQQVEQGNSGAANQEETGSGGHDAVDAQAVTDGDGRCHQKNGHGPFDLECAYVRGHALRELLGAVKIEGVVVVEAAQEAGLAKDQGRDDRQQDAGHNGGARRRGSIEGRPPRA